MFIGIAYIGDFILDLWNLKCVFDFLVRKVRSVLKVRRVRTNQLCTEQCTVHTEHCTLHSEHTYFHTGPLAMNITLTFLN